MPRIPDELLDTVIYLYPSVEAAEKGERIGGTGFLISYPTERFEGHIKYAVTNRHVVEQGNSVIRLNTQKGDKDVLDYTERHWLYHPAGDDLAIAGLPALSRDLFKFSSIPMRFFVTLDLIKAHNIGIGDDVIVIGRFINREGKQRNIPTARFGNVAQMPSEPVAVRIGAGRKQESFLVEARSISGYSGSPVLVDATSFDRPDRTEVFLLLGVQCGYITDWHTVCDAAENPVQQRFQVRTNTGMMAVVPAWKVLEILELPQMKQGRIDAEERFLATKPPRP